MVIWITGITASGKTTIGVSLLTKLKENGISSIKHLDGDTLRKRNDWVVGHSITDRQIALKKIVEVCLEEKQTHEIVIVSTVSHLISMRNYARSKIQDFHEIFLDVDPVTCSKRDHKNLYEKAFKNMYTCFPGVTEEYQKYDKYNLALDTGSDSVASCSDKLLNYVLKKYRARVWRT